MAIHSLEKASLFLDGKGAVQVVATGPDFYARVRSDASLGGTMVSLGTGSGRRSSHWEMHPAGEEILVVLGGPPIVRFEHEDGRRETLQPAIGDAVIVPRGVWHRAEGVGQILYITYGAGTTHKSDS
jgi:quercetin dioxygenase-like cupin family protein